MLQQRRNAAAIPVPSTPVLPAQPSAAAADPEAAHIAQLVSRLADPAADAREKARRELAKIGEPAVPDLLLALDDIEERVRTEAARALAPIRSPQAAEPLVGLLGDPSREVWHAVYDALVRLGAPARPALVEALGSHDRDTRWKAVHALGWIGGPDATEALIAQLNKDQSTGVRVEIATALGRISDRIACDALLDALHDW